MATALNTTMTSLHGGGSPAKNIFVYRNGDTNFQCKKVVVNPRQIKNWDSFIELITNRVKAKNGGAVRRVFTPTGRTKVHDLTDIENNHFYVAAGSEGFQRHEYNKISGLPAQRTRLKLPPIVKPVQHSRLKVSARCRRAANAMGSKVVFVFRNADDQSPAVKILFNRFMLKNYEVVLDEITKKVNLIKGAVYKLYTLEGKHLSGSEELEDREFYVACGKEEFKKVPYRKDGAIVSPRATRPPPQFNFIRRKVTRQARASKESKESKPSKPAQKQEQQKEAKTKKPTPPKPTRKSRQEKTQEQKEAEEVFHSKPTMVKRSREKERGDSLDFSDDPEGVFKAKEERDETKNAEEVQETNNTTTDLPIDQVVAEEIDDEEIKDEVAPAAEPEPDNIEERLQQDDQQEGTTP